jgi:hypothetical protein
VLDWRGDLDNTIPIPKGMKHGKWVTESGSYHGTLAEKYAQWHKRFSKPGHHPPTAYQKWTYRDLKELCAIMRKIGKDKYGFDNVKIGSFVVAWKRIYGGKPFKWSLRHPEAFSNFNGRMRAGYTFDAQAKLEADNVHYGAYPHGIPKALPLWEFFGKQWGSLSKKVGLDAIVLRDGMLGPGVYTRLGPFGKTLSPDIAKNKKMMQAQENLVRVTKQSNPKALVMGYSSGASAVGDWRTNAFDLGFVARQGYLDAYIDQTWAGAWNEVGLRSGSFWNFPSLGWTPQMAFMLIHGAVLAGTNVKHYQLTETFDAWESWDVIHTAPQRLKWGIWAYSHAAVKEPGGLQMPSGAYISWCNKGKQLLSKKDVSFLKNSLDHAYRDAAKVKKVYGPTLVYNRSALKWQNKHAPSKNIKAWIDEYAASLMKWGVPIMSATRIKYLDKIKTDLPVLQTPIHVNSAQKKYIINEIDKGKPFMIIGSPAGGISPDIARKGGLLSNDKNKKQAHYGLIPLKNKYSSGLATVFKLQQSFTKNRRIGDVATLYSAIKNNPTRKVTGNIPKKVENISPARSPALVITNSGRKVLTWDPPEYRYTAGVPMLNNLGGDVEPYVITARAMGDLLKGTNSPFIKDIGPHKTMWAGAWQLKDGTRRILTADLEEGITFGIHGETTNDITIPKSWGSDFKVKELWHSDEIEVSDNKLKVGLDYKQAKLFRITNE